jgi:hypothetical protein
MMSVSATLKWATGLWAFALAVAIEAIFPVFWWYPYCNRPDNGPGYPGIGFPLPYRQFTGVSSEEYFAMPHVYILNIILLSLVIYMALWPCFAWLRRSGATVGRIVLAFAGAAAFIVAALQGILMLVTDHPVASIAEKPESYFSYRPEFMALRGSNRACENYPAH